MRPIQYSMLLARRFSSLLPAAETSLRSILGERLSLNQSVLATHGTDESFHIPLPPAAVVYPQSTDEVVQAVKICAEYQVPIIPFGVGTSLEGHIAAMQGGVSFDMTRMNNILEVNPEDMDCRVQAGVTREDLNVNLRDTGLFFPVDPGANATIGGMASTRASGTNAVRYGTMRDNVKNLTVVTANGDILKTGSRARKSSAGYDLTALFVGAEGTLRIITEVGLKLYGQPEAVSAALCPFPTLQGAVDTATEVMQSGIPVARIELLDELAIDAVNKYSHTSLPVTPTLFMEFHGSTLTVQEAATAAGQVAKSNGCDQFQWADALEERTRLWNARHTAYWACVALKKGGKGLVTDMCVPLSKLTESVLECRKLIAKYGLCAPLVGHVGDANFHFCIIVDPESSRTEDDVFITKSKNCAEDKDEVNRAMACADEMVHIAQQVGGTCTGEHGIGYGKLHHLVNEHGLPAVQAMHEIKKALDPMDLMNPGKLGSAPPFAAGGVYMHE